MATAEIEATEQETTHDDSEMPEEYQSALDAMDNDPSDKSDEGDAKHEPNETTASDESDSADQEEEDADAVDDSSGDEEDDSKRLTWQQEQTLASQLGINVKGMKREDVRKELLQHTHATQQRDAKFGDLRRQAQARGLTDTDLADFESPEELQRALTFLDRQAASTSPKKDAETQTESIEQETIEPQKLAVPKIDFEALEQQFEPEAIAPIQALHEHATAMQEQLDQMMEFAAAQQETAQAENNQQFYDRFDEIVDQLEHPDMFGDERGKATQEQMERRNSLWNKFAALSQCDPERLTKGEVESALHAAFHSELKTKLNRVRTEKVRKQSGKRLGAGSRNRSKQTWDGKVSQDPDLHEAYDRLAESQ